MLHTCLEELQPKTNGVLRRAGACRVFATVTQLTRTKRPGKPDYVYGLARCFQLRISIVFNSKSLATSPLHFGPVTLPACDPANLVRRKSVLYGMVVKTARGFQFSRCTQAQELYFFFTTAFRPTGFFIDNMDAYTINGRHDLFALATMLQGSFDAVLEPLKKYHDDRNCLSQSDEANKIRLSYAPVDFVILACLLVRDGSLYRNFIELVNRRKSKMHRSLSAQILQTAVPFRCLEAFITETMNEKLDGVLNVARPCAFGSSVAAQHVGNITDNLKTHDSDSDLSC